MASTRYLPVNGALSAHNLDLFGNRPIYCANTDTYILVGDLPLLRLGKGRRILGTLEFALKTAEGFKPLYRCAEVGFSYQAGLVRWEITDPDLAGTISLTVAAPEGREAMLVELRGPAGSAVYWRYGGLQYYPGSWGIDPLVEPEWLTRTFVTEDCHNNTAVCRDGRFILRADGIWADAQPLQVVGSCSQHSYAVSVGSSPYIAGCLDLGEVPVVWGAYLAPADQPASKVPIDLSADLASAIARSRALASRVEAHTPEPALDAVLSAVVHEVDGAWYPPRTMHSTLTWNGPYLGWNNRYGNTLCGWHERMLDEVSYYTARMHTADDKQGFAADPARKMTVAAPDSRFYGLGHVDADQHMYNMQTQFFDQAIHAWYATGDEALLERLRPALELHTRWQDECFDPDGDGIYESCINSWPTDSVWYNGGGSVEETCYAWRSHCAAAEMAELAGDEACARHHREMLSRIREGFFRLLWITDRGHPGKYREQGGHRRLHPNPWLYGLFMPVDVGLLDAQQAVQALDYTRWALQNDHFEYGGRMVWMSNWVPSIWSVRELAAGENLQLAYAYFRAGMPADGLDVLMGTVLHTGYNGRSPARIASEAGSLLYRAVIDGLFGYQPDYPHKRVRLAPEFPPAWREASIKTPDVELEYHKDAQRITLRYQLHRPVEVEVLLPIYNQRVVGPGDGIIEPHFGRQILRLPQGYGDRGEVVVELDGKERVIAPLSLSAEPLAQLTLRAEGAITALDDPQGILTASELRDGIAHLQLAERSGQHMLFAQVGEGAARYWQVMRLDLAPTAAELAQRVAANPAVRPDARYQPLALDSILNADVRTIYRQQYLEPRPATTSVRIGTDGYSPWTFTFWENDPPVVKLDRIPELVGEDELLQSPRGVPFSWPRGAHNIAFTSLWENWPARVELTVGRAAEAVWLHLCGTTNPMQCGVPNARVVFHYADGVQQALDLVNPDNFWSLCPLSAQPTALGQGSNNDYNYSTDGFALPVEPPETLQLGENCRSVIAGYTLRPDVPLESISLMALSQEVVIGLMGVTLQLPE
ncbi:MAG: hypothetical protein GXY52_10220 [Chloroflexi bacterium]|nr:hypothetical protein [Chloroflexota bacterium]